jgi:hypothetical protein
MLVSRRLCRALVGISLIFQTVSSQAQAISAPGHIGEINVDTGFRTKRDGFSFANWGGVSEATGISPAHVLQLFRNAGRCSADLVNPSCVLRNGLVITHDHLEEHLAAGRCEGMAILAGRIFLRRTKLSHLSQTASRTNELTVEEAGDEIAYWWASQLADNIIDYSIEHRQVSTHKLAHEIILRMQQKIMVTIGIYTRNWSHSVLAIKGSYRSNVTKITVYDSNFPGETRILAINHFKNTWTYKNALMADGTLANVAGRGAGGLDYVPVLLRSRLSGWSRLSGL